MGYGMLVEVKQTAKTVRISQSFLISISIYGTRNEIETVT